MFSVTVHTNVLLLIFAMIFLIQIYMPLTNFTITDCDKNWHGDQWERYYAQYLRNGWP